MKLLCGDQRGEEMNFYDKKFKKIVAITVLVLVIAMLGTSILPYIM